MLFMLGFIHIQDIQIFQIFISPYLYFVPGETQPTLGRLTLPDHWLPTCLEKARFESFH